MFIYSISVFNINSISLLLLIKPREEYRCLPYSLLFSHSFFILCPLAYLIISCNNNLASPFFLNSGLVNTFKIYPSFPFKFSWYGMRLNKHKDAMDIISLLLTTP